MMELIVCPKCGKAVRELKTVLVVDHSGLNAWNVECCAGCKSAIKRRNTAASARRERAGRRKKRYR